MNVKFTPETEADLLRGIEWFDTISLGLGDQLESEFCKAIERIKSVLDRIQIFSRRTIPVTVRAD